MSKNNGRRTSRVTSLYDYREQLGLFRRYLVTIDKAKLISEVVRSDIDSYIENEQKRGHEKHND